jgi:NOL1/NOP2/fmu family ribosome biogenesis protein
MSAMAAIMVLSSILGTRKQNKNAYRQQLQIVGDTKSTYANLVDSMESSKQVVGLALTKNEMVNLKKEAAFVAKRAKSNTAGASAMYAYNNFTMQKMFTKGTIVAKGAAAMQDYGKSAEATYNRARSGINQAEAKKKGALEATLDAVMAGGSGASTGNAMGEAGLGDFW